MNAVDVVARGLARRALDAGDLAEGFVNIRSRTQPTAAALETLTAEYLGLAGYAGDVHTVEAAPYLNRDNLAIRGNGAELRNTNDDAIDWNDYHGTALPLGLMTFQGSAAHSWYSLEGGDASSPVYRVAAGMGAHFAPGDNVLARGAGTSTTGVGLVDIYTMFRHHVLGRVVAVDGDDITLERPLPASLLADTPQLATTREGVVTMSDAGPHYILYRPTITDLTLRSDNADGWKWGGVVGGSFRRIKIEGRMGLAFNAMQDSFFEDIRIDAWRGLLELGQNSRNTTIRFVRGALSDASTRFGGASDMGGFFISLSENCVDCTIDDAVVSSGPNDSTSGSACILGNGVRNKIVNSKLSFPAHTGTGLSIINLAAAGFSTVDSGFENVDLDLPRGAQYFSITDLGAGMVRPYLRNVRCTGAVTTRAGVVNGGTEGVLQAVRCEAGALLFNVPVTGWRIEDCHFPAGFAALTQDILNKNLLRNNTSDASLRIEQAAIVNRQPVGMASNTPNNPVHTMVIAPGDLAQLDEVHFRWAGSAVGGGVNVRHVRVSVCVDGVTDVQLLDLQETVNGSHMRAEGRINVRNNAVLDAVVNYQGNAGSTGKRVIVSGGNLNLNGLILRVQIWTATSGAVEQGEVAIAGQKAGMRSVRIF